MKSYKPEVKTSDGSDWAGNVLRFATEQEALDNVRDLMMRWFAVTDTRVVPSEDAPNYTYIDGKLEEIKEEDGEGYDRFYPVGY